MVFKQQEDNGVFIFKIYDTFTILTIKLIYIISNFYQDIYIYKPYFSRPSDCEKYVICKKFKNNKNLENIIIIFENILLEYNKNQNKFIFDILPSFIIDEDYINKFKFINIKISNLQQIMVNDIISYIKANNYFGENYHKYRERQIEANAWWLHNLFPPISLFEKNKEDLMKLLITNAEKNELEYKNFVELIK